MHQEAITQLRRHLKAVLSRRPGQALWLWGEPGIGKTFTAQALLRETPCQSLSLHATLPDRALLLSLPRPPRRPAWTEVQRQRLMQSQHVPVETLVDTLAATLSALAPFVLHLEDAHEADPERLELVQKLAQVVPRLRGVGLLVTSRGEPPPPFKGYRLEPLSQEESEHLLRAEAGHELPQEGLDWVFSRAKGNPLFTLEFWRYLARQGYFWSDGRCWHWHRPPEGFVPVTIEALLSQLASSLASTPTLRAVLEARAALPTEVAPEVWVAVAGVEPAALRQACAALQQGGILRGSDFVHPLIPEVIWNELPDQRRREYAFRALWALEGAEPALAAQYVDDAGLEPEEAGRYLERAARRERENGNLARAAQLLARSAARAGGPRRASLALEAARWFEDLDVAECERLARLAMDFPPLRRQAAFLCAAAMLRRARPREAWQLLQTLPEDERGGLEWWQLQLQYHRSCNHDQEVLKLWEEHPELHPLATANEISAVANVLIEQGDYGRAEYLIEAALERSDLSAQERAKILDRRNAILYRQAQYEAIEENLNEILGWLDERSCPLDCAFYYRNRSMVRSRLGRHGEARSDIEKACKLYLSTGAISGYTRLQTSLGLALIYQQAYEEAEKVLLECTQLAQQRESAELFECHGHLSFLYLRWGPPYGKILARRYARLSLEAAQALGKDFAIESALEDCARAELLCGEPERALEYTRQLEQVAARTGREANLMASVFLRGRAYALLGERESALSYLRRAIELYRVHGQISEALNAALEIDRLEGNLEAAREKLEWFEAHGHAYYAEKAQRYFPQLSEPAPTASQSAPSLCIKVLGPVELEREGEPIAYRGRKRLELLCYLLEARIAGRAEVSGLELADAFYPAAEEARARATLKQQVHLIRMTLGPDAVQSTPGGYALGAIRSDAEEFLQSGDTRLWRGPYLERLAEGWHGGVREALTQALSSRAEALLESDPQEASRLAQILLEMEPYDTGFLQLGLRAARQSGSPKAAARLYKEAQERFLEVGEVLPGLEALLQAAPPPA